MLPSFWLGFWLGFRRPRRWTSSAEAAGRRTDAARTAPVVRESRQQKENKNGGKKQKKIHFFPTKNIQKEKKINVGTKSQPDVKPLFRRQTNRVPPFSSEFYSSWIGFYRVGLINTQLNWFLSSFTGFYWVLLGFTGFYWVLLGFTGFY